MTTSRVERAFRPASKLFIFLVITSGLQPARDLLFLRETFAARSVVQVPPG